MPELPEILTISSQMRTTIAYKKVIRAVCLQPKCLNTTADAFSEALIGRTIGQAEARGKWIVLPMLGESEGTTLLIHLGMGGDLLYHAPLEPLPDKYQLRIDLVDGSAFTCRFWWFGHLHLVEQSRLSEHPTVGDLGPSPLDRGFTVDTLNEMVQGSRCEIKSFILNQRNISGIGNAYSHDILFSAGIHPQRKLSSLSEPEIAALYNSMRSVLQAAVDAGGASYELDFYGNPGGFTEDMLLVGYREGQSCPRCGTLIQRIKTGSTNSFICPSCQPL